MSYKTKKRRLQRKKSAERIQYWKDIRRLSAELAYQEWKAAYFKRYPPK